MPTVSKCKTCSEYRTGAYALVSVLFYQDEQRTEWDLYQCSHCKRVLRLNELQGLMMQEAFLSYGEVLDLELVENIPEKVIQEAEKKNGST